MLKIVSFSHLGDRTSMVSYSYFHSSEFILHIFLAIVLHYKSLRSKKYEKFLKTCELLKNLRDQQISKVADALEEENMEKGEDIILQGSKGDHFYMIASGKVEYIKDGEVVGEGVEGDFFGELALLKEDERAATVKCKDSGLLLSMDRHHFVKLLGSIKQLSESEEEDTEQNELKDLRTDILFEDLVPHKPGLSRPQILGRGAFGEVILVKNKKFRFI